MILARKCLLDVLSLSNIICRCPAIYQMGVNAHNHMSRAMRTFHHHHVIDQTLDEVKGLCNSRSRLL